MTHDCRRCQELLLALREVDEWRHRMKEKYGDIKELWELKEPCMVAWGGSTTGPHLPLKLVFS